MSVASTLTSRLRFFRGLELDKDKLKAQFDSQSGYVSEPLRTGTVPLDASGALIKSVSLEGVTLRQGYECLHLDLSITLSKSAADVVMLTGRRATVAKLNAKTKRFPMVMRPAEMSVGVPHLFVTFDATPAPVIVVGCLVEDEPAHEHDRS